MEKNSYKKALNSYAVIKASWLEEDYISSFVPMFATLMLKKQYKKIDIDDIDRDFKQEYNIQIPRHPIVEILNLMRSKNMIFKNGVYFYPIQEKLAEYDIRGKSKTLETQQDLIFSEIVKFAKDNYKKEINNDTAKDMLYSYLQQNSASLLNINNDISINNIPTKTIIADYIKEIYNKYPDKFSVIKQITIGKLLVEAISFNTKEVAFDGLNVFLDTKYLLNILGCYGNLKKEVFSNLTEELLKQKVNLLIFSHTDEEMMFILRNAEKWIESPDFKPNKASSILRRLRSEMKTKKDIQEFMIRKKSIFQNFNIKILDKEEFDNRYQIDENLLEQIIFDLYKQQNPDITDNIEKKEKIKNTILYDIKSITKIYQQRKGKKSHYFQEINSILLTTNKTLTYASKIFHDRDFAQDTFPSCITDSYISTLIWSINGIGKFEDIIEKKLVSDCFSAMEPSQNAIDKYCSNIQNLYDTKKISENDSILLRSYGLSTKAAKPIIISPDDIEDKDIFDILEEVTDNLNKKSFHEQEKLKRELEEKNKEIEEEKNKNIELDKEKNDLKQKVSKNDKIVEDLLKEKYLQYKENYEKEVDKQTDSEFKEKVRENNKKISYIFILIIVYFFICYIQNWSSWITGIPPILLMIISPLFNKMINLEIIFCRKKFKIKIKEQIEKENPIKTQDEFINSFIEDKYEK